MKLLITCAHVLSTLCILALLISAVANAQENNSLLGGMLRKSSSGTTVMTITISPNAPSSQAGRTYNNPVGGAGAMRDTFLKMPALLPLAARSVDTTKLAGDLMSGAVEITIPQVNFGFKGRLSGKNVCIGYKKRNHKCDNDEVFIEEYTTFILKGSYASEEVNGTFFIVQPWRYDSSFSIPVDDIVERAGQDLKSLTSQILSKMKDNDGNKNEPPAENPPSSEDSVVSVVNAFLITTDKINHVCFESTLGDKNQKLKEKYIQGIKVFAKSSNSDISLVERCPQPALNYCDSTDNIKQYFYEKARTKGNEDLGHSKASCEKKGGKWF